MIKEYYTYQQKYQPIDTCKPLVLAIVGKSATGKDTLAQWLTKELVARGYWNTHKVVSDTTRPPREGEVNGIDYLFISEERFKENIANDRFLEYTKFKGWYYGIDKYAIYGDISIVVVNPAGLRNLLKYKNKYNIIPIYLDTPPIERLKRSIQRENKFTPEYFRRMMADRKDFRDIRSLLLQFDHKIVLTDVDGVVIKSKYILDYLDRFGLCGLGNSQ